MRRFVPALLVLVALVAVALVTRGGGDDKYTLGMRLANAGGLRDGSPVVIGGVPIGVVKLDADRDFVDASLEIDKEHAPLGKDVVAGIIAQNVIGQKQVRLTTGDRRRPAPDGYRLPARQVLETTDLDQLLSTFDPDTRTRLAILINETGTAFAGRKLDFNTFLRDFAPALGSGGQVLTKLTQDNRALTGVVTTSDRFIKELAAERKNFARALDNAGQAAETVAAKRSQLRGSLREAPGALRSTRTFLAELRQTTAPLAQTARLLTRTAPSLSQVLDRIGPFQRDAGPRIRKLEPIGAIAHRTAGTSKELAKFIPVTADLRAVAAKEIAGAGSVLGGSVNNAIGAVDNWAHAIQVRDGLGHIFRGEASFAPDFYQSLIDRLVDLMPASKDKKRKPTAPAPLLKTPQAAGPAPATKKPAVKLPGVRLPKVAVPGVPPIDLDGIVKGALPATRDADRGGDDGLNDLLDYLLGA